MKATEGIAKIFGLDLNLDSKNVKKITSCCPQIDIIWPCLSIYEHFELFGALRGLRGEGLDQKIDKLLKDVDLLA